MERGTITIHENNVILRGNVWMTDYEITEMFGVTSSAVNSQIKAVYKSGVLNEYDTYQSGNDNRPRFPAEQPARQSFPAMGGEESGDTSPFTPAYCPPTERRLFMLSEIRGKPQSRSAPYFVFSG